MTAQDAELSQPQDYQYQIRKPIDGLENYQASTYYYSGRKIFNTRGGLVGVANHRITNFAVDPKGKSCAVVSQGKRRARVEIFDLWSISRRLASLKVPASTACGYSAATHTIAVADSAKNLYLFQTDDFFAQDTLTLDFAAQRIEFSPNGSLMVVAAADELSVWNLSTHSVIRNIAATDTIRSLSFVDDNSQLAVLTQDGSLITYETTGFLPIYTMDALGVARDCDFHPEGKYISVVTGDNRIMIANLMDASERQYIDSSEGGITSVRFVKDDTELIYLVYNTNGALHYKLMSTLSPNHTKLLADELSERMAEWEKQMPGETLEDYRLRVNDETRATQMRLYSEEIATRMAENLVTRSEVSLGSYNPTANMLTLDFNTMPTIYLTVPKEEVGDFMNPGDLEFSNVAYGLTAEDKFEMTYAEIYNKASQKSYTFDNRARESLDFLNADDQFIPLALAQQNGMESMQLEELKERIISSARQKKTISDHTQITVSADVIHDVDAEGNKILNYQVGFTYTVEQGFSGREDFGPGKYRVEESGAASSMLRIIQSAFEGEFAQYVQVGKKVIVRITGSADALPIRRTLVYNGEYGDFVDVPVYLNQQLEHISVTRNDGISTNEQLAFLRSTGVQQYIVQNISTLQQMKVDYQKAIEIASGTGSEYRRIRVEFTFVDAF
jgi:WD40 repeat protein